eukprot:g97.t1
MSGAQTMRARAEGKRTSNGPQAEEEEQLILPIFFYNDLAPVGTMIRMHLFEPRYRLMISRITADEAAGRVPQARFLYLPSQNYYTSLGNVGMITLVRMCQKLPDGRANVVIEMAQYGLVTCHWIEPDSWNLSYARVKPLGSVLPRGLSSTVSALSIAADNCYQVCAGDQGSIGVYREPRLEGGPNRVSKLDHNTIVNALEHHEDWIRHRDGWSLRAMEGRLFLLPAKRSRAAQIGEDTHSSVLIGPELLDGSRHVICVAPQTEVNSITRKVQQCLPARAEAAWLHVALPPAPVVSCEEVVADLIRITQDMTGPSLKGTNVAQLKQLATSLGLPVHRGVEKEELLNFLQSGLHMQQVVDALNRVLSGLFTQTAFSMPLPEAMVSEVIYSPSGIRQLKWDVKRNIQMAEYLRHEYAYEASPRQGLWNEEKLKTDRVLLRCTVGGTKLLLPSSAATLTAEEGKRCIRRCSRHINWPRARLLFLGERSKGSAFFHLDSDLIRHIINFLSY